MKYIVTVLTAKGLARILGCHDTREAAEAARQEINARLIAAPWAEIASTPCQCSTCMQARGVSSKVVMQFNGHDIEGDAATLADINNKLTQHAALLAALRDMMKVYDRDPHDAAGWIVRARAAVAQATRVQS